MIKFAVCDDEQDAVEHISDKLREYYPDECEIKKYTDGKKLLEDIGHELFDAFFLDIGMPSLDGFKIAKQIRSNDPDVKIIFVTGKEKFAHLGYIYGAFRFVRKSRLDQELFETAESLYESFSSVNEYLSFKTQTGEILIAAKDIKYIESDGHALNICGFEERILGTMQELEERLKNRGFIRIHKSFLVNIRYFRSIDNKNVTLSSGEKLPMSRNRIAEVKKRIHQYFLIKDEQ